MGTKETFYIDPFLVAGIAAEDSVLAYHSALELHDIAYTTFETLTFLTRKHLRPFNFRSQKYQAVYPLERLLKKSKENFAVETIVRSGMTIKLTSIERTIVDVIDRPEISGGWEEIWRSLEHLVTFDMNKLKDYLILLDKAILVAKVGFFLDTLTTIHGLDKEALNQLLAYVPKQPCYLERGERKPGNLVKKWNLIVPDRVFNQTWEEKYESDV